MNVRTQLWGAVFAIMTIGVGLFLRGPLINSPPREYWTVRQYPSLLESRVLNRHQDIPAHLRPAKTPAPAMATHVNLAEPPVREFLAACIYKVLGREEYWPLQAMSLAAWGIGAFFLYLLCSLWRGPVMGCAAVAFFMFFPYGHLASIGIMPDVPMTGLLIAGMWSIHWYWLKRSAYRFVVSALICALTVFIKPGVSQFAVILAFLLSAWSNARTGCFKEWRNYVWGLVTLGPAVVWLLMNTLLGGGWFERILAQGGPWANPQSGPMIDPYGFHPILNIKPSYLLTLRFWRAWLGNLVTIFAPWGVGAGLAGLALLAGGKNKPVVLFGWIAGYLAQCCLTTWTTMSHDYWHLQAIPLAAIGVGTLANTVYGTAKNEASRKTLIFMAGAGMLGALLMGYEGYKDSKALENDSWYENACKEIGSAVNHSPHCLFMDWDSGWSLRYFADIGGGLWPDTDQLVRVRRDGLPLLSDWERKTLETRMEELAQRQGAAFEYFICMRKLEDLDNQPDLRAYLADKPMVVQGPRYCVWDLREANKPVSTPFKKSPKTNHDQLSGISHPANSEDNLR